MVKFSQLPNDTTPANTDFIAGYQGSNTTTSRFSIANLLKIFSTPTSFSNPVNFHYYLNAGQSTGTGGFFLINIDTKVYDTGNNFNATTHLFTAPAPGFYVFNVAWQCLAQSGSTKLASLAKNSTTAEYIRLQEIPNTTGNITIGGTIKLQLVTNDTIGFLGYSTENKTVNNNAVTTYFQGYLDSAS